MKRIVLVLVMAMAIAIGFGPVLGTDQVQAGTGYAQLTMENSTPFTLDLYVDGNYACRSLSGGFCTTHVREGFHTFSAKASNGLSTDASYDFYEGDSITWTVTYEPPQQ